MPIFGSGRKQPAPEQTGIRPGDALDSTGKYGILWNVIEEPEVDLDLMQQYLDDSYMEPLAEIVEADTSEAMRGDSESYQNIVDAYLFLNDDESASHREDLVNVFDGVVESLHRPGEQQQAAVFKGMLEWCMFGRPGEPLPKGLVLTDGGC